ncbi:MAG: FAD:protein FMN transferase [Myxococcales bacterium FL481]|nr:MAG: FAD:protein FMN transferase [Myxococcales bacterium FL481]
MGRRCGGLGLIVGLAACPRPTTESREQVRATTPVMPPAPRDAPAAPTGPASPAVAQHADRGQAPPVRRDGTVFAASQLMGTRFSINVWLHDPAQATSAGTAIRDAFAEMARIESIASEWQPQSAVSLVNARAGGPPVAVPIELVDILERAAHVSQRTDGRFDITFYSVGSLWRFDAGARPPDAAAIQARLPRVDWRTVHVDRSQHTVRLEHADAMIGLGAIAKGYAVDQASRLLRERGFANHIVEGGGDTYVSGRKGTVSWQVGIKEPGTNDTLAALPVRDQAVVTSGTYERYFEHGGTTYTHILDPATGWPIPKANSPVSVTLVADNATDADAYATAVMVMGSAAGLRFLEQNPRLEGAIISASGELLVSTGLRDDLRQRDNPAGIAAP